MFQELPTICDLQQRKPAVPMADISSLVPRIKSSTSLDLPIRGPHCLHNISRSLKTLRGGKENSSESSILLSIKTSVPRFLSFSLSSPPVSLSSRASSSPYQLKEEQDPQDSATDEAATHVSSKDMLREKILKFAEEDVEVAAKKYNLEEELFSEIDFAQINAFTDRPFSGNPAAVCYLPMEKDDQWLQYIAREFNLSETAFLIKRDSNRKKPSVQKKEVGKLDNEEIPDEFNLRWFTPKVEVTLCGHATLASAHLLFSSGIAEGDTILFHTKSGILKARKVSGYDDDETGQNEGVSEEEFNVRKKRCPVGVGVVELDFPLAVATKCDNTDSKILSEVLGGVKPLWAGQTSLGDYLVEVSSSKEIEQVQPDFSKMMDAPGRGGFIVTARAERDTELDFISRFFCPKAGILEDPVTGSAHCTLGPYWADKLGKMTLKAFQASERGGHVTVRVDKREGRAYLQGSAVLVMAGVLLNTMRA